MLPTLLALCLTAACGRSDRLSGQLDVITEGDSDSELDAAIIDALVDAPYDTDATDILDESTVIVPVGPPVQVDDHRLDAGDPHIAWNGEGWGIVWSGEVGNDFRVLDELASPLGPIVNLGLDEGAAAGLEWKDDRYAIVLGIHRRDLNFAVLNPSGAVVSGPNIIGYRSNNPDMAWANEASGWVVSYYTSYSLSGEEEVISAVLVDDHSVLVGDPITVHATSVASHVRVVALKTRVSFVWPGEGGIWFRSFRWPDADHAAPARVIFGVSLHPDAGIEAEGYLDDTVIVFMDGASVQALVVEPMDGEIIHGPEILGTSGIRDRRPAITASSGRSFLGVCYQTGNGPAGGSDGHDGFNFRLIGSDGSPIGDELVLATELLNACDCAVGWNGYEFVVLYSVCGSGPEYNNLYAQRVLPVI